jgi:hypothetical protein
MPQRGWAEHSEATRFLFETKAKDLTFNSSMVQAQESMASAPLCAPYLAWFGCRRCVSYNTAACSLMVIPLCADHSHSAALFYIPKAGIFN